MTPMIDVLLVLIIIFMVITPIAPKGLEARAPQPAPPNVPEETQERSIVVSIDKHQGLKINQEPVLIEDLGRRLENIFKSRADRVCFVKGDGELEYQMVTSVIDTARGVGIYQVGLMTAQN